MARYDLPVPAVLDVPGGDKGYSKQLEIGAGDEWRAYWTLVLAAFLGFSFQSQTTYSAGLFMEPLAATFGWTRAQATLGLSIAALASIPMGPVIGIIIDRWGVRIPALIGMLMTAAAVSLFGLASGAMSQWIAMWVFYALVATGIKSTVWATAVTGTFNASRGLALGCVMCGAALAQIVTPPLTRWLIDNHGWRSGYAALGMGWGGACFIIVALFFFDARAKAEQASKSTGIPALSNISSLSGLSFRAALTDNAMITIAITTVLTMFVGIALIVHQVPILTDMGVSRASAAYLASLSGVAGVIGKLATGWMSDRWDARRVGGLTVCAPAFAIVLLLEPFRSATLIVVAMIIIGYSSGAKLQISAYLSSRYVGMRNFGKIFGIIGGLIAAGTGLGPVTAAWTYDYYGSYTPFLYFAIPSSLFCGILLIRLPVFPARFDVAQTSANFAKDSE